MPELPEIETVKLQLQKVLIGQKLLNSSFAEVNNKKVLGIERIGKVLLIRFSDDLKLGFHFKMTGQLVYDPTSPRLRGAGRIVGGHPTGDFVAKLPSKHTRAIFYFNKGTLYFNDQRKFGWVQVFDSYQLSVDSYVSKLGPEPFQINSDEFISRIQKFGRSPRFASKNPIKVAIMDQSKISGVGNIYANDALWESQINPATPVNKLSVTQLSVLFEIIKLVLREGIKYGGATSSDYVDLHGLGGHYQEHFRVYNRENLPCLRCQTPIKKIILGGRGTYFCPKCQV